MSEWTKFVKKTYIDMKKKDKNVKLGDAMKHCGKLWKSKTMSKTSKSTTKSTRKSKRKTRKNRKH